MGATALLIRGWEPGLLAVAFSCSAVRVLLSLTCADERKGRRGSGGDNPYKRGAGGSNPPAPTDFRVRVQALTGQGG